MLRLGSWCEVNLVSFRQNLQILQELTKTPLLLVVKADAYGHGIVDICEVALSTNVKMLGVATLDEASAVSDAFPDASILVMSPLTDDEIIVCVERRWHFFIWTMEHLKVVEVASQTAGYKALVHIQIDTGMGRDGLQLKNQDSFFSACLRTSGLSFEGFATHFYGADMPDPIPTNRQIRKFECALVLAKSKGIHPNLVHAANSPGLLRFPEAKFNLVRAGIVAYGLKPDDWMSLPAAITPILEWKAKVTRIEILPSGHGVSYGSEYRTTSVERVATISVGYADGFRRYPPKCNFVLFEGQKLPVLGRVCMDQIVVGAQDCHNLNVGSEVVILGRSGDRFISADDLATRWLTNSYDVLVGIRRRVPRHYERNYDNSK